MLRTITLGSCVSVQGLVVGHHADGKVTIRVDEKTFVGYPVNGTSTSVAAVMSH